MDETFLYVRIRGRVQGPFDLEKLRALVRRGQLGRLHEVSTDNVTWQRAGDFPNLFSSTEPKEFVQGPPGSERTELPQSADGLSFDDGDAPRHKKAKWFYAHDEQEHGPVDFATLQSKITDGEVLPEDQVWSEGMHDWATADSVAGLVPAHIRAGKQVERAARAVEKAAERATKQDGPSYGRGVTRTLVDSQPWILFICNVLNVFSGLLIIFGILGIIFGAYKHHGAGMAWGFSMLIQGCVIGIGTYHLLRYRKRINIFLSKRTEQQLDFALRSLRSLWIYTAIILSVMVVIVIVGGILLFCFAFDTPFFSRPEIF